MPSGLKLRTLHGKGHDLACEFFHFEAFPITEMESPGVASLPLQNKPLPWEVNLKSISDKGKAARLTQSSFIPAT